MGELIFVGMGLGDENDLTLRAVDELRAADVIYAEQYTSRLATGSLERLSQLVGKPVKELTREDLEAERAVLDPLEQGGTVALLVTGEPFAATTHLSLRLSAEKRGHSWRVLHNASILTAAASLAGLSLYRFGRVVSLPDPSTEGYRPTSPYEALAANRNAGLHTLILLDIDAQRERYLTADLALRHLGSLEEEFRGGVAGPETLFCVVARVGGPDAGAWAGPRAVLERQDFGPPLHALLLPGPSLHFLEREALTRWKVPTKEA
jgi:diphthine synthase